MHGRHSDYGTDSQSLCWMDIIFLFLLFFWWLCLVLHPILNVICTVQGGGGGVGGTMYIKTGTDLPTHCSFNWSPSPLHRALPSLT